jgi:hypothetical protein
MKKVYLSTLTFLMAALAWNCSTEDLIGSMEVSFSGQTWNADFAAARVENNLLIVAGKRGSSSFLLAMPDSVGSYPLANLVQNPMLPDVSPFVYIPDTSQVEGSYLGFSGEINLTASSNLRVSGNFTVRASGVAMDTVQFTGNFKNLLRP